MPTYFLAIRSPHVEAGWLGQVLHSWLTMFPRVSPPRCSKARHSQLGSAFSLAPSERRGGNQREKRFLSLPLAPSQLQGIPAGR